MLIPYTLIKETTSIQQEVFGTERRKANAISLHHKLPIHFLPCFFLVSFLVSRRGSRIGFPSCFIAAGVRLLLFDLAQIAFGFLRWKDLSFLLILFDKNFFPFSYFYNDYKTSLVGIENILYLNRPVSLVHYLRPLLFRKWKYWGKVSLNCSLHFESLGECLFTLRLFIRFETNSKYITS